eukprot:1699127-Pleurochrysis_carterae.AAC.2
MAKVARNEITSPVSRRAPRIDPKQGKGRRGDAAAAEDVDGPQKKESKPTQVLRSIVGLEDGERLQLVKRI